MDPKTKLSTNRFALLSCSAVALAVLMSPGADHVMMDWLPSAFCAYIALAAAAGTMKGYLNRRRFFRMLKRARRSSQTLAGARFATLEELEKAGMLDLTSGPLLCTMDGIPVFLPPGKHYFLEGPTGAGKSSCIAVALIFHLAHLGYSVCVSDLKPELCHIVGPELERRGFRICYNNPKKIAGLPHHDANPFAPLVRAVRDLALNGQAFPLAETFALELTPESDRSSADNQYFRNLERQLMVVMVLALAAVDPDGCIPSVLHRHAADPKAALGLLFEASETEALNGDLAAEARGLINLHDRNPEHFEGARTGLANALSGFRSSSDLGLLGVEDSFDAYTLRDEGGPATIVFDLVPAETPEVYVKALALQSIARMFVVKTVPGRKIAFCLDEATNLPVKSITKEITLMRSRGAFIAMLVQSRSEVERVYGNKAAEAILGNCVEQYLQVGDTKLAEFISKRVGEHTVVTESQNASFKDGEASTGISEQARPLLPVDAVLALPGDTTLTFVPGMRPIMGKKIAYYDTAPYQDWAETNPQEPHPKSALTKLTLQYGEGAHDAVVPVVVGLKERLKATLRRKNKARQQSERLGFDWPAHRWVPIALSVAAFIAVIGTPHILYEHTRGDDVNTCVYVGADGVIRNDAVGRCPYVIFDKGWEAWRNR